MKIVLYFFGWILIGLICQAQDPYKVEGFPIPLGGQKLYTWEALNLNAQVSEDGYVILSSTRTRTKATDPCSSAVRQPVSYTNWWTDSTEQIINGAFDTDSIGWYSNNGAWRWVASGGGFTGAIKVENGILSDDGFVQDSIYLPLGISKYRFKASINITANDACSLWVRILKMNYSQYFDATGVVNIDTVITRNSASGDFYGIIWFLIVEGGSITYFVDNVSLYPIADSTQTMSKILTGLPEDTPFYWYSSLLQFNKGQAGVCARDTFYHADAVDTFYTLLNTPTMWSISSPNQSVVLSWVDNSLSESGQEILRNGVILDTVAANIVTYTDNAVTPNTHYQYRIKALGTYLNSEYSNLMGTTTGCDAPDTISVLSAVGDASGITLTWTDVTSDSVSIYRGLATNPSTLLTMVDDGVETYRDEAVTQGLVYYYRLGAYDSDCDLYGAVSATVFDTVNVTDNTPPSAPTGVDAWNITRLAEPEPVDTIPSLTSFTNITNAQPGSYNIGYIVATLFDSCTVYAAGDTFSVGSPYTFNIPRRTMTPDTLFVPIVADTDSGGVVSVTITAGGVSRTFTVTTLPAVPPVGSYNVWYVGRDDSTNTTGTYNGTSWATCWTKFNRVDYWGANGVGIDWSLIEAGDTIYVDGGYDSLTYTATDEGAYGINFKYSNPITFASGNTVVICPGKDAGHNGDVWFTDYGTSSPILWIANISNVKITGFKIKDNREGGASGIVQIGADDAGLADSLIYFEDNHIIGEGYTEMCYMNGTKITLRGNTIENLANDLPNSQDPITVSGGKGGHTIDGNLVILRNSCDTTDAHRDMLQFSNVGYNVPTGMRLTMTISNNLFISTTERGNHWNNMVYCYGDTGTASTRFLIYNNIMVNRKNNTGIGAFGMGRFYVGDYNEYISVFILNNTIISKGANSGGQFTAWSIDTLVMKNNIFIKDSTAPNIINIENGESLWDAIYKDIDYNYYGVYGGSTDPFAVTGVNRTWAEWLLEVNADASTIDDNGAILSSSAITFTNKYDTLATGYYTTTGRDLGVNLWTDYPFLRTDHLGNARGELDDWDVGALEYQGGGLKHIIWKRVEPIIKDDWEQDFWKGGQR